MINFDPNKTYPVALLIHGGPESSWTSGWSYRWNPEMFSNYGYAVVMINPHGSTGVSTKFREAVRRDWGGVPYEDIINGLKFALNNNKYMDPNRVCAAGGSYGGYMINWIAGHTDMFKCLVNHDGDFSEISAFYSTDDLYFEKSELCPEGNIDCNPFDGKEARELFEKYSPEKYVKNWKTPMLVIHGGRDYRVQLTEALSTFTSLQLMKIDSKFLYFPLVERTAHRLPLPCIFLLYFYYVLLQYCIFSHCILFLLAPTLDRQDRSRRQYFPHCHRLGLQDILLGK